MLENALNYSLSLFLTSMLLIVCMSLGYCDV